MFDNYTLKARFYPVIILFLPIVILGLLYSLEFQSLAHLLSSTVIVGALTYLFSQLGRDQGKLKENGLWESWGGMPTVQLLRLNDSRIDLHTKTRYHKKLQQLCPVSQPPDAAMESNNAINADEVYKSWTKYLLAQTRDHQKFPLLIKDNTSYGFRRNLWGLKRYSIILILLLLLINYLYWFKTLRLSNPLVYPENFFYTCVVLLLIMLFWILIIRKRWVKIPAFSYAERLCEATEVL